KVAGYDFELKEDIDSGHKIALKDINKNDDVFKYGSPIGTAIKDIKVGEWIHSHNMKTKLEGLSEYEYVPSNKSFEKPKDEKQTFQGYVRKNGDIGIRNEIWIINTVGCINKTAELLAKVGNQTYQDDEIDGIYNFPHPYGCSQLGDDLHN